MARTNTNSSNVMNQNDANTGGLNYLSLSFTSIEATKVVGFIGLFLFSSIAHQMLRPLAQPRLTSDFVIGMIFGNINHICRAFDGPFILTLNNIVDFGMICHMFVVGLEMNPYVIFKTPTHEAMIAYSGMLSAFLAVCFTAPFLHYTDHKRLYFILALSVMAAGNGSPILTRLITNLKIGKSDIGKLGISSGIHSDMISTLLYCIGFVIFPTVKVLEIEERIKNAIKMASALVIQIVFTAKVSPLFLNWVNNENPEGKPLKGSHLVMFLAFMVLICSCPTWYEYNPILSAFTAGLFLPKEGRMSKWIINKINYLLSAVFYPIFFFWVGYMTNIGRFNPQWMTWARLFSLLGTVVIGKIVGTVICGLFMGYHFPETIALGLLLTAKAHFQMFLAALAIREGTVSSTTGTVMVVVIFLSVVHTPFVVMNIIERAKKRVTTHRMALQRLDPSKELRILLGLHGPNDVPLALNFLEISRGPTHQPGTLIYATDLIEMTDEIEVTVERSEGVDTTMVKDKSVTERMDQITSEIEAYVAENGEGVTVKRMQVVSPFVSMAQDICVMADELMISFIVLPFRKQQNADGSLEPGHAGFRYVNRKVLRNAPCSIGILVDNSFGKMEKISRLRPSVDIAIIFIGGKDDRVALAFAEHVARHPGVKLTVIRFLVDKNSENAPKQTVINKVRLAEQEDEMKLDDECFANFYETQVAGGHVSYMEKHLANSSETFTTLRTLEGRYSLIIVGREGRVNNVLTMGLKDWQMCPELGPVGDVLSGFDVSVTTSVLVIQQQNMQGQIEGLDDNFSIM